MARQRQAQAARAARGPTRRRTGPIRVVSPSDAREAPAAASIPSGERLPRKLRERPPGSATLWGGDVDAAWDRADAGEEAVGGSTPMPDQDNVYDVGEHAGLTYRPAGASRSA